jgi:hypothetical protein
MPLALMKNVGSKPTKQFNPEAFRGDMMKLPPHEAADVTLKWRERAINAAEDMAQATDMAFKVTAGGAFVFLVGMMAGRQEANSEKLLADWAAGGAEEAERNIEEFPTPWSAGVERDPTKFLGFLPIPLALTAIPAVIGIFDTSAAPYFRSMALAGTYFFVGKLGEAAGKRLRQNRLKAGEEEAAEAAAA